jgi:hypothetical protein
MMGPEKKPRLPPGYRLDRSDPEVWVLRQSKGWVVGHFRALLEKDEPFREGSPQLFSSLIAYR